MKNFTMNESVIDLMRCIRFLDGKMDPNLFAKLPLPPDAPKRASVVIHPGAYAKMVALIQKFSTEIGWHGLCYRNPECDTQFIIEDIVVYPQNVTGTSISTDETRQGDWLDSFDDATFRKIRFHGHSHVNMSVFSSGTDDDLQRDLTNMLRGDDFYLFFIMNKKMEIFARLYDNKYGVVWETNDIDISIDDNTVDIPAFLEESKALVKEVPAAIVHYNGIPNTTHGCGTEGQLRFSQPAEDFGYDDTPYGYYDKSGKWVSCREYEQ